MRKITSFNSIGRAAMLCFLSVTISRGGTLSGLATAADVIVVGTVSTRTENGSSIVFDINVETVLKGSLSSAVAHVSHPGGRSGGIYLGPPVINSQIHGMWALVSTATADWDVLPVRGPSGLMVSLFWPVAATLPPFYQSLSSSSLLDTLTIDVAAGVESEGLPPEELIGITGPAATPVLQAVFTHFLASPALAFRSAGLAGMLVAGQQDAMTQLSQVWPSISADTSRTVVLSAIRGSFRDQTAASVQQLVQASSTSAELRSAAVWALAAIHTQEALPFLAGLLGSSDPAEQARGVFGLSSFANGCPPQTRDNLVSMGYLRFTNTSAYRTSETMANFAFGGGSPQVGDPRLSQLVAFWLNWWNQNKASLN